MFKLISAGSISAAVAAALVGGFAAFFTPLLPRPKQKPPVRLPPSNGKVQLEYLPAGFVFTLDVPLSSLTVKA